ncbi:MAG: hypothetical protein AAB599_00840, partial [Patescibacteria group bacterium]
MNLLFTNLIAEDIDLGNLGGKGLGPLQDPGENPGVLLEKLVSSVIGLMTVGAILWFSIQVIIAGYG